MLLNPESESLLLSSFIHSPQKVGALCVEGNLNSEAFTSQENAQLYRFLLGIWSSGTQISPHLIGFSLKKEGMLSVIGGPERLQSLCLLSPSELVIPDLILELKDLQRRRALLSATKKAYEDFQGMEKTDTIAAELGSVLSSSEGEAMVSTPTPEQLNKELVNHAERSSVIPTGFKAIDDGCGSLYLGDMLVVAGGAKAGKSTLAANIATHISRSRFVVIFTIEMNRIEFWKRIVNASAGVSTNYWHPTMSASPYQHQQVKGAMRSLENAKMTIIDSVQCIEQAFAICRALKAKHGELGAVVIDYLQMFSTPEKTTMRSEAVSCVSRACKRAATALQTLVIAVSQLNDDGKSLESRGIQRDCNMMLNVLVDEHGNRSVVSAFNRNGPMGIALPIEAQLQYNRFVDA